MKITEYGHRDIRGKTSSDEAQLGVLLKSKGQFRHFTSTVRQLTRECPPPKKKKMPRLKSFLLKSKKKLIRKSKLQTTTFIYLPGKFSNK